MARKKTKQKSPKHDSNPSIVSPAISAKNKHLGRDQEKEPGNVSTENRMGEVTNLGVPIIQPLNLEEGLESISEEVDLNIGQSEEGWVEVGRRKNDPTTSLPTKNDQVTPILQLDIDDIKPEVDYWSTAVICYVVGANPPSSVLTGFINRIWGKHGVDKVSFLPNGVFLVRLVTKEAQVAVLEEEYYMFDSKPMIVQEWSVDMELHKTKVDVVPIWVRLYGLPLKFWGDNCLKKLAGLIGKPIRRDEATRNKTQLGFARMMVEVKVGQVFPGTIKFMDEDGKLQEHTVQYEWKPVVCGKCKGMGHEEVQCKQMGKPLPKQVWKPKVGQVQKGPEVPVKPMPENRREIPDTPVPSLGLVGSQEFVTPARILTRYNRQENVVQEVIDDGGRQTFLDILNRSLKVHSSSAEKGVVGNATENG